MKKFKKINLILVAVFLLNSCTGNLLSGVADKTSDEALLFDINLLSNKKDYTLALSKFSELSATTLAERSTQFLLAKVYGGLCGFDFLEFSEVLASAADPNENLFQILMNAAPGSTVAKIDYCILSESTITFYASAASDRTNEENLYLFLLQLLKMGKIFNTHFDSDDDQVVDGGLDACSTVDLPNSPTEPYAQHLVTAFAIMSLSATEISSSVISGIAGPGSPLALACAAAVGLGEDVCNTVDPLAITVPQQKVLRTLVKEDDTVGLGVSCTGDVVACNCP